MASKKYMPSSDIPSLSMAPLKFSNKVHEKGQLAEPESAAGPPVEPHVDIDLREIYFLIMHFLSAGPCHRTNGQFWNELLEHQLLPRRYHAWYSRSGAHSGDENDDGMSFPLSYNQLVERYPHIAKDHVIKLMKQLILNRTIPLHGMVGGNTPNAADVPTLLGSGFFSLLESDRSEEDKSVNRPSGYLRWPHMQADQVRGLSLREIGGGFTKHHRSPSIRAACYAVAKPSTMVRKMQNVKKLRGHRNAVYCAIFDRSGRYVITGSDDRLVKIWSMETAFCLASCRGHEGDITDLAVSSNNFLVASASNDFNIRVWRLPDGAPVSVLRGHTSTVTAIAFSPRPSCAHHLLSSSDDGTCRIWDARHSQSSLRVYIPRPDPVVGKSNGPSSSNGVSSHQILCCAYNANGTVFVTGSSDTKARVWNACKASIDDHPEQQNHEMDLLSGHENDVNYVQFSGCHVASRSSAIDTSKEDNLPRFKNSWFTHDNIVTCSRDGSAIIWIPRSRRFHGKVGRWTKAYHLKVPPPPMPPQTSRGGPRQRFLPTPRGVNMIVWSLDNRFVLAAIMDCRICVWNASDGSLVHSLTGHTQSTYVLDVHPFNPRIAMSAGYDGLTIVWDIWEGTPIHTYEMGRFKLVDGKFSPDGTSIVLSDDVGQIYILSTGQGESQKDAKYDQFFLGDYRPLIRDITGNVLDQETQLVPYRRNMQDLLCDSSMIPYPEPYQSMYQKRRLGALGIEWQPSSVNLAVGPVYDLQDYQILPLPDLDRLIEGIPEFIDAMDWEPENEIQSEDNDSEYNITEEYLSEGDHGSPSDGFTGDPECSEDTDDSNRDGFHPSKRRKHKAVVEVMTSSGRRVKRKNLDDQESTLFQCSRSRKPRNRNRTKKKKSSSPKFLRPQRVAARNALNKFSQYSGGSSDEDEDEDGLGSGSDTSESESIVPNSTILSRFDGSVQRGKEVFLGDSEDAVRPLEPKFQRNDGKKRLIFKFSANHSKKSGTSNDTPLNFNEQANPVVSFKAPQETTSINTDNLSSQDLASSSGDMPHSYGGITIRERELSERPENLLDWSGGIRDDKMRWGDVKARTSKRLRSGDSTALEMHAGSAESFDEHNHTSGNLRLKSENGVASPLSEGEKYGDARDQGQLRAGSSDGLSGAAYDALSAKFVHTSLLLERLPEDDNQLKKGKFPDTCRGNQNKGFEDDSGSTDCKAYNESLASVDGRTDEDKSFREYSGTLKWISKPPRKIRIKWTASSNYEAKSLTAMKVEDSPGCNLKFPSPCEVQNLISEAHEEDEGPSRPCSGHGLGTSDAQTDCNSRLSSLQESKLHVDSKDKMYKAFYTRSKSSRARTDSELDGGGVEESTSNPTDHNYDSRMDLSEPASDRRRSIGMRGTTWEPMRNNAFKVRGDFGSIETLRSAEKYTISAHGRSNEGPTVGLRSVRNRRTNYYDSDINYLGKRKSHHSMGKLSWLMLSQHEESRRYIPQLGDNVVYLRQGHQQYLDLQRGSDLADLWKNLRGEVRAVEFCKVDHLSYSTHPGSGESCCKIKLRFVDPSSSVFGESFQLNLPELENSADFIVEKTLYDASIKRDWRTRDKCEVWWRNEDGEGGSWWEGRIMSIKPKSPEFPDSPWERFTIKYKNDASDFLHGPWELHDPKMPWQSPSLDEDSRMRLLNFFSKLEESDQDRHGIHKLRQVSWKPDFLNRFDVPLSWDVIKLRLESCYYRNLEAVGHDFDVMLENAGSYFGRNADLQKKMNRLLDSFEELISMLSPL